MTLLTSMAIFACLLQSALFSGLNLGLFSLSRLELQVEARKGNPRAQRILALREDSNFALVTILWGNVGVNVLLALLSGSVFTGVVAFGFSTVVITIFAEIIPQSYFTRHALRMASALAPMLRCYQWLLYPIARPTALVLDAWLGGESIRYLPERDLRQLIRLHMDAANNEIQRVEGQGALNFLELDDVAIGDEGEPLNPDSILSLPFENGRPLFPAPQADAANGFLHAVGRSGMTWVVIADPAGEPRLVLNADEYLREAVLAPERLNPFRCSHRPIVVRSRDTPLGELIPRYHARRKTDDDDIVDDDVILLWDDAPRIVTGTDILGRLLRGIAQPVSPT